MNILWHMPTLRRHTCGLSARALRLASELRRQGHGVRFVVAEDKTDIIDDRIENIPLEKVAAVRRRSGHWSLQAAARRRAARSLVARLGDVHDLMVSCQPEVVSAYRRRFRHRPLVFVCGGATLLHDAADAVSSSCRSAARRLPFAIDRHLKRQNESGAFAAADINVFDSRSTRATVIATYGIPASKCFAVHGGLDPARFHPPSSAARAAARAALGLSAGEVVAVWTGRIAPEKNLELLIRSLRLCQRPPARVLLVGDGPLRNALRARADREGVSNVVSFVGATTDVRPFLHAADLFVFPSRSESFGAALVEAMACGLPCVALRSDGRRVCTATEEIFGGADCGVSVESDEPRALAATLDDLVARPERRREIGRRAAQRVVGRFAWAGAGARLNELVRRLEAGATVDAARQYDPAESMTAAMTSS
ncbi:MAG: glycosyltransferase family 4 protein [Phycisphaerae bacterium]